MDDVSELGPLWVSQLRKEVAARRNRAAESLMTVNPDGAFAEQHLMLIELANTMLAAPALLLALRDLVKVAGDNGLDECDAYVAASDALAALESAK